MNRPRKTIALIDFENIKKSATIKGGIIDFKKLREMVANIGEILFSFVFIPDHRSVDLPSDINSEGFEVIVCQRTKDGTGKLEDTVDVHIIKMGMKFCNFQEVTDIVIVGHDGHMIHLVSEANNRKKKVSSIGIKEVMSKALIRVVDVNDIYDLPIKI